MKKLNYETINEYQSFASIEEMDQAVRGFLYVNKSSLSEGTLKVLHFIWRHSVKVIGVSFAKYNTIATQIGISRRTVIRAVNKLESLNFFKKVHTLRENGKQGVNLIVIQPYDSIDQLKNIVSPQVVTLDDTPNKTKKKQRSLCENNKPIIVKSEEINQNPESIEMDTTFLPETIHKDFVQIAKSFFRAEDIYLLWNRVLICHKKCLLDHPLENLIHLVIKAFKQTIFMKKLGKIHTTFEGYFYSILYSDFITIKRMGYKEYGFEVLDEIF